MRNYQLRNKYKQAAKKLAYIVSRISEPPSYRFEDSLWWIQNLLTWHTHDWEKYVYILFYINFKHMENESETCSVMPNSLQPHEL